VTGILKGYDQLLNLVLDEVTEELQCASQFYRAVYRLFSLYTQCPSPMCAL
jgi:small nuclear ribonucleoprotein (snRNP)-like protein